MKTNIGIVFGGRSGEHEIAVRSAKAVIEAIDKLKYNIIPIAISKEGKWLSEAESVSLLPADTRSLLAGIGPGSFSSNDIAVLGDTSRRGVTVLDSDAEKRTVDIDVVFPVLHGTFGEDGTIQGIFEMADIPYIGCGVLSSSCGMDKAVMKVLFKEAGLPICRHVWFLRKVWEAVPELLIKRIETEIDYPCFVKPANLGSSVGVSKADDADSLMNAIGLAAKYDRKIIVEEALEMREIECGVIGNDDPLASLPGEYLIRDKDKAFLDYDEKYSGTGNNEFVVPARVSSETLGRIQQMAVTAFKAIDASGLARVDFFLLEETGELLVNEINTMPGLTDASGFPKMWAGTGLEFSQVIDKLVEFAIERHNDNSRSIRTLKTI